MKTGTELISIERQRQIEQEGWTPEHDDQHVKSELAINAAELAVEETDCFIVDTCDEWGLCHKHHGDRIRQLAISGALIAAEIDRLQRAEADHDH